MFWTRDRKLKVHLVGIGGSGMSGIAELLLASQFEVSGSDLQASGTTKRLESLGAKIAIGHMAENISGAGVVVVSSAVSRTNPEILRAHQLQIPVIPRAEMLAELMRLKKGIAVAGSHGKTTTTSMIGQILTSLDPTVVVGGRLQHWNASSVVGRGAPFVIEADESDRSFLKFSPVYSIVTNVDLEHLDEYKDLSDIQESFLSFLNRTAFFGMNWINADCPELLSLRPKIQKPTRLYGFHKDAHLRILSWKTEGRKSVFELEEDGKTLGSFEVPVVGLHNVSNATGAIGVALSLGLTAGQIKRRLKHFVPADRRLQTHFEDSRIAVIEDYGHHPTEIRAALQGVRLMHPTKQLCVIFQPHRYTRTKSLWNDFIKVLREDADQLWLLPIYAAHEKPIDGISSEALCAALGRETAKTLPALPVPEEFLNSLSSKASAIVVLGAAPLSEFARQLSRVALELSSSREKLTPEVG